ncbi:MAG: hypothetical protein ACE5GC_05870 [Acidimicrobiia bacterium]
MIGRRAIVAIAVRPKLWPEALRALVALSRDGWWRRGLPRPEPTYAAWRVMTAYGTAEAHVAPEDAVAYLRWRRRQRASGGG